MGRSLDDTIAARPPDEKVVIKAHHDASKQHLEGLRELRQNVGKAQADIASALNITNPSVSKIEIQTDMHLSTLRHCVKAVGGELEMSVKLRQRPALPIFHLGNLAPVGVVSARKKSDDTSPRRRHG
ncbi:MAG: DNA-binding protein [Alphaproteobacteria bacterium]|nr:MAG: DNA-binding protein [Alphaproteobacteria bacterium]